MKLSITVDSEVHYSITIILD